MNYLEDLRETVRGETINGVSSEEACVFLENISVPVFQRKKGRQVLCANLLENGEMGPLVTLRRGEDPVIINKIETDRGKLPVPDEIWAKGLGRFVETCGLTLEEILPHPGEKEKRDKNREERMINASLRDREDIVFVVVRKFDPETKKLTLLGIEVGTKEKMDLSGWREVSQTAEG